MSTDDDKPTLPSPSSVTSPAPSSAPDGDVTEPLGGATSGEDGYVAVNGSGISGERHVPTADEEIGRGSGYDPQGERYPSEEHGD